MITADEMRELISQHTGTQTYHKLIGNLVVSDGVKALMEAGASWLIDIIVSVQPVLGIKIEPFQCWKLAVDLRAADGLVTCTDGNKRQLYRQELAYTDFPIASITIYAAEQENLRVIYLSGEH